MKMHLPTDLIQVVSLTSPGFDHAARSDHCAVHKIGTITLELTNHIRAERNAARKKGHNISVKPIKIEVTFSFAVSGDKGVVDVSARSGKKTVGEAKMEWETNSKWVTEVDGDGERIGEGPAVKEEPSSPFFPMEDQVLDDDDDWPDYQLST